MPVKISSFHPTTPERVEALRQRSVRRGDPVMHALLTAVEAGQPQEIPLDEDQSARGLRIAIARAAGTRGFAVDTYESEDERGQPVVIVVKADRPAPRPTPRTTDRLSGGKRPRRLPQKPQPQPEAEHADLASPLQEAAEMVLEDQATAIREDEGERAIEQDEAAL
jgi:hypothetical protein